jgi:hypothetical protein
LKNPTSDVLRTNDIITLRVGENAVWMQPDLHKSADPWITNKAATDIFLVDALLTPLECQRLIDMTEMIGYRPIDYVLRYRSNSRVQIENRVFARVLFDRVKRFMPDRGDWEVCGLNPQFRFCKYDPGQDFKQHVDGVFDESATCKSFFTLNVYLNQEFEGGATRFYLDESDSTRVSRSIKPQTGLALFFDHRKRSFLHDGEEVQNGQKYIMRTDVMYRKRESARRLPCV